MGFVVAGLTAGVLAAPAAMAGNFGTVKVVPEKGESGATVAIEATCSPAGLKSAPVVSEAIHAPDLAQTGEYTLKTTGKVNAKTKPGKYQVSFQCWSVKVSTTFEVLPSTATPPPTTTTRPPATTTKPKPKPQVVVRPKAAPETGGGGTAG
jgi:hypothetical protein